MLTPQQQETISFLQEIVRIPSLSGQEGPVMEAIQRKMAALGYDEVWVDGYGNVIGKLEGHAPGGRLLFDAHADIVEVTSRSQWKHDPFAAEIEGGLMFGRGSNDTKGGLAAAVCGLGRLARTDFRGTIYVAATIAEEVWEGSGQSAVVDALNPEGVVVVEPTQFNIGYAQKGRAGVYFKTRGVAAHTARPELGVNAVYKAVPVIERLRKLPFLQDDLLGPGVIELIEIISSPFPGTSTVPDECRVRYDYRMVRGETKQSMMARLREAVADADVEVGFLPVIVDCYTGNRFEDDDYHPAWGVTEDHRLVQGAAAALAELGITPKNFTMPFCTNASYSAGTKGLPAIVVGPGAIGQAHTVDECVEVAAVARGADVYAAIAKRLMA